MIEILKVDMCIKVIEKWVSINDTKKVTVYITNKGCFVTVNENNGIEYTTEYCHISPFDVYNDMIFERVYCEKVNNETH